MREASPDATEMLTDMAGPEGNERSLDKKRGKPQHAGPVSHVLIVEWSAHHSSEDISTESGDTESERGEPQPGV